MLSHFFLCALGMSLVFGQVAAQDGSAKMPAAQLKGEPPRTAALIDFDRTPLGALLQAKLFEKTSLTWLEREAIGRILKEKELQTCFGADGVTQRTTLGRLLKADLLILLRMRAETGKGTQKQTEFVVCETRHGLRLLAHLFTPSEKVEDQAAALEQLVQQAIRKHSEGISELYAVPPFLSRDLTFQFNYLQSAYAKIVEQVLLERKGSLVVEFAEAQAIIKEMSLADPGERLARPLPLYLLGEFRHEGQAQQRRVGVSLQLKRGQKQLGQMDKKGLPSEEVPPFLRGATLKLIGPGDDPPGPPRPREEAKQLAERARDFQRLGLWSEALDLIEASLLLEPDQPELRHDAIVAITRFTRQSGPKYALRGLEHLETFMAQAEDLRKYRVTGGSNFLREFLNTVHGVRAPGAVPRKSRIL